MTRRRSATRPRSESCAKIQRERNEREDPRSRNKKTRQRGAPRSAQNPYITPHTQIYLYTVSRYNGVRHVCPAPEHLVRRRRDLRSRRRNSPAAPRKNPNRRVPPDTINDARRHSSTLFYTRIYRYHSLVFAPFTRSSSSHHRSPHLLLYGSRESCGVFGRPELRLEPLQLGVVRVRFIVLR